MGPISWIIFGALAGWVANMVAGDDGGSGLIPNILTGIVGAFIGGLIYKFLGGSAVDWGWNLLSFIVAVIGSVILLALLRVARR